VRWGLAPGEDSVDSLAGEKVSRDDYFNAGVALARGAYCGDGASYTLNGTSVLVYDLVGLTMHAVADLGETPPAPAPPGKEPEYYFEAGWTRPTKTQPSRAVCLSKLRWASMVPGGYCPAILPDPRIYKDAHYCEDLGPMGPQSPFISFLLALRGKSALVFSSSTINQAGLLTWWKNDSTDRVATSAGYWAGEQGASQPPYDNYQSGVTVPGINKPAFVANVFKDQDAQGVRIALHVYRNLSTGDRYTSTKPLAELNTCPPWPPCHQWTDEGVIGWVYASENQVPSPLIPVALRTWYYNHDRVLQPGNVQMGVPWQNLGVEGYGFKAR
jgi:hypothetical protein